MAQNDARLQVVLEAKIDKLTEKLSQANSAFHKTAASIDKRQRELDKNLAKLGDSLGRGLDRASLVAGVAFGAIVAGSIEAAKRAEAVNGAFEQTFRAMPKEAAAATAGIAKEFSRLETDIKENFTQLSSVMTALGVSGAQTLSVVDQLQRRSLDIAAFKDVSDAQAFQAVISGITGETEPLKRFGIVVNETAVKAELLKLGFKGNSTEASEAAKVIARANIILRQSGEMAGQVAREADTLAEQQKRTRTEFLKTAEEFGQQFLPVAKQVLGWATDALKAFNDLPTGTQNAALGLLALVAAGGPIVAVIKGLKAVITAAVAARAALAAVAAVGAGGAAKAAAGGAAKRGALAVAGAAVGTVGLAYTAGSIPAERQDDAERLRRLRDEERRIPTRRGWFDRDKALAEVRAEIAKLEAQMAARKVDPGTTSPAATTPSVPDFQGFDLTPDLLKPVAGSGGGKGAAKKAADAAARAAEIALNQQERTDALIGRANEDLIAARNELVVGAEARYQAELEALESARVSRAKELDYDVKQGDLTEAQRKRVETAEEAVRLQDEANALRRRDAEVGREQLEIRLSEIETQAAISGVAAQLATTARARRDAELRLLELADQRERAEIEAIIASKESTDAEKQIARNRLAGLEATADDRRQAFIDGTRGPLEDYLSRIPRTADEVNEAMQRLAVDGLESLSTGLADAIVNAQDLGDVAKNVFRQMVADLLAESLRKNLAAGGAALLKFIPGIGRNADGTNSWRGGLSLVGERGPELVNLPKGSQVIPNDVLRSLSNLKVSAPSGGHATLKMEVNVVGAIGPDGIAAIAKREAQRGGALVLEAAKRGYPTVQQRTRRLGTQ
jgi:hypothetical protein